jgi:hypothetical protein
MLPLYHDPHFTFRFADDRIIPRFHLEGVGAGRRVDVFRIDPATGERLGLLTTGVTGDGGWVVVEEPITVRAGDAFVAVPEEADA